MMNQVPASYYLRQNERDTMRMRHHSLGKTGWPFHRTVCELYPHGYLSVVMMLTDIIKACWGRRLCVSH